MKAARMRWMLPLAMAGALVGVPHAARSQAQSPVVQMLASAPDARTRVQAATTLGRMRPAGAREALQRALDDVSPAVRAAAAQALINLGDVAALPALRAHVVDRDSDARAVIVRAIAALEHLQPSRGGGGGGGGYGAQPAVAQGIPAPNWQRARFVVRLGTLSSGRATNRAGVVDVLRSSIAQELARHEDVAFVPTELSAEAAQRVRSGRVRAYALEGSVNTLRRWTVAATLSVRAEVSLVLVTEPSRAIVGSMSGAATAQDAAPGQDADGFTQRLEDRALAGAVRGALSNLRESLHASRR